MNIVNWTINGLDTLTHEKEIIIKVDDTLLSTHSTQLPPSKGFSNKKAISFALEDNLLSDIEELEFFSKKSNGAYQVLVISKALLAQIKATIKERGLNVKGVYPNFMFVPFAQNEVEDEVQYFDEGEYITYRTGLINGGSMQKNMFFEVFHNHTLSQMSEYSTDYALINLIQIDTGEFVAKYIRPWIHVLVLCIAALGLYTYSTHLSNVKMGTELERLQAQNTSLFKTTFPDITKIVDTKRQAQLRMENFTKQETLRTGDLLGALESSTLPQAITNIRYDETLSVK